MRVEEGPVMKLSEAIRLGSTLRPQGFGSFFTLTGGSCAVGAAAEALGVKVDHLTANLDVLYQELARRRVGCPQCDGTVKFPLLPMIGHINDVHCWTRERIADWVESVESMEMQNSEIERKTSNEDTILELSTV